MSPHEINAAFTSTASPAAASRNQSADQRITRSAGPPPDASQVRLSPRVASPNSVPPSTRSDADWSVVRATLAQQHKHNGSASSYDRPLEIAELLPSDLTVPPRPSTLSGADLVPSVDEESNDAEWNKVCGNDVYQTSYTGSAAASWAFKPDQVAASGSADRGADRNTSGMVDPFTRSRTVGPQFLPPRERTANQVIGQYLVSHAKGEPIRPPRKLSADAYAAEAADKMFHPHGGRIPSVDFKRPPTTRLKWVATDAPEGWDDWALSSTTTPTAQSGISRDTADEGHSSDTESGR